MGLDVFVTVAYGLPLEGGGIEPDEIDVDALPELIKPGYWREQAVETAEQAASDLDSVDGDDLTELLTEAPFTSGCGFERCGPERNDIFVYASKPVDAVSVLEGEVSPFALPQEDAAVLDKRLADFLAAVGLEVEGEVRPSWHVLPYVSY